MIDTSGLSAVLAAEIDFLAGRQNRAPSWMRRFKLEWLHRLLSD
ncbi:MAG: WecB/TagA/CpsF family glycosyltransferase, partial [Actinomycetota bacterium]